MEKGNENYYRESKRREKEAFFMGFRTGYILE